MLKDSFSEIFSDINKVLVVLAHPDDMEVNCGGLMARLRAEGREVRLVVTTNGGKGMKDKEGITEENFATGRIEEQKRAGEILGILESENFNLNIPDGELFHSLDNIEKIAFHIRQFAPDVVITHNPEDIFIHFFEKGVWVNHNDHRNTGLIVADAVYPYSRDRGFFPEHFTKNRLSPHIVTKMLIADSYTKDAVKYFSIGGYIEQKRKALQQHVSAFSPDDADSYIEENKFGDDYFEPLAYYKIY